MARVSLREIGEHNRDDCLALRVAGWQSEWVAPNAESLDEPGFVKLAIQDGSLMVGFTMYEIKEGVGFIRRLMIDERFQGKGYGRAAMEEVIRRLKLHSAVKLIATRHRRENEPAAKLYRSLGFVDWKTSAAEAYPGEVYLRYAGR